MTQTNFVYWLRNTKRIIRMPRCQLLHFLFHTFIVDYVYLHFFHNCIYCSFFISIFSDFLIRVVNLFSSVINRRRVTCVD